MAIGTSADLDALEAEAAVDAILTPVAGPAIGLKVFLIADEAPGALLGVSVAQRKNLFAIPARYATPVKGAALSLTATGENFILSSDPTYTDAGRDYWRCPAVPA